MSVPNEKTSLLSDSDGDVAPLPYCADSSDDNIINYIKKPISYDSPPPNTSVVNKITTTIIISTYTTTTRSHTHISFCYVFINSTSAF